MNIYVINMDKDVERLKNLELSAKKYGIEYTRVSGILIDDKYIEESTEVSSFVKNYGTNGIVGAFLAHKKIWAKIVEENIPYAVILEDDIEFTQNFKDTINTIEKDIPTLDFDILLLSSLIGGKNPQNYNFIDKFSKLLMKTTDYEYINDKYHYPEYFAGLQSYIVTYKSALKLLDELPIVSYHIDLVISASPNIKKMAINEPIINSSRKNSDLSNNSPSQYFLDKYFKNVFVYDMNLTWMLNVNLLSIPIPNKQTPTIINPRFVIKLIFILFLSLFFIYYNLFYYWYILLLLFIIILYL